MPKSQKPVEAKRKPVKSVMVKLSNKKSDNPKSGGIQVTAVEAMEALRSEYAAGEKSHHERVRANICTAYELGLMLQDSKPQWTLFMKRDWRGITGGPPKEHHQADAVRFALKFMVGNAPGSQKEASFYFRAIKKWVDKGVTPAKLRAVLQEKPLRDLAAGAAAAKREAKGKSANSPGTVPEKSKKIGSSALKKVEVETVSEPARDSSQRSPTLATCTLALTEKAQTSLLKTPVGTPITIKGKLLRVGSSLEIEVNSLKKRERKAPVSQSTSFVKK